MRHFEIQYLVSYDWENMSNEAILEQMLYLTLQPHSEALKKTKAEVLCRMTGGKGWAFFETSPESPIPRA